jgi:ParB/RepB/Spo0J family partition protein
MHEKRELLSIPVSDIEPDLDQPRKSFDSAEIAALSENIKAIGLRVPAIVYPSGNATGPKYRLADGERRWLALPQAGIAELLAMVLPKKPDAAALRILQMSLEVHKVGLSLMERSNFLKRIQEDNGWSVSEIAVQLQMKQPLVSKLLSFQKLDSRVQELLHKGDIDGEKAVMLSQEPDLERQWELATDSVGLTRDELRQRLRRSVKFNQPKTKRAVFALPTGTCVTIKGSEVSLSDAIGILLETVRELKRGQSQRLDITTQQRVMKDKAKAKAGA